MIHVLDFVKANLRKLGNKYWFQCSLKLCFNLLLLCIFFMFFFFFSKIFCLWSVWQLLFSLRTPLSRHSLFVCCQQNYRLNKRAPKSTLYFPAIPPRFIVLLLLLLLLLQPKRHQYLAICVLIHYCCCCYCCCCQEGSCCHRFLLHRNVFTNCCCCCRCCCRLYYITYFHVMLCCCYLLGSPFWLELPTLCTYICIHFGCVCADSGSDYGKCQRIRTSQPTE